MRQYSKDSKLKVGDQAIFWDNVLLEMNLRPAKTYLEFSNNFKECLNGTEKFLNSLGRYYLKAIGSADFSANQIEEVEAKIFGCEPEFCIYERSPQTNQILRVPPPVVSEDNTFRSCGGHIHIGHVAASWELGGRPDKVIKLMDGLVGTVSVLLDQDKPSILRRKLYGGAGSHRITSYGVEYRTPSNFWFRSPSLTKTVYQLTRKAVELMLTKPDFIDNLIDDKSLQTMINASNVNDASQLYNSLKSELTYGLQEMITINQETKVSSDLVNNWQHVNIIAA